MSDGIPGVTEKPTPMVTACVGVGVVTRILAVERREVVNYKIATRRAGGSYVSTETINS